MREIKFRGKRKDNGEWVYGDLIHERYGTYIQYITQKSPKGNGASEREAITERYKIAVESETVGQYTGVKDFTGREIYEGDIVKVLGGEYEQGFYEYRFICAVKWTDNGFDLVKIKDDYGVGWGFVSCEYCIIVIGNICENPELLELLKEELK